MKNGVGSFADPLAIKRGFMIFWIIGGIILFLAVAVFLSSYFVFRLAYLRHKKEIDPIAPIKNELSPIDEVRIKLIERLRSFKYENVYTESRDGLRLHAKYYHSSDTAPLMILCHGYRSVSERDFSGGGVKCIEDGCNVLLIDQRAHGESEGRVISFGIKEREDVLSWIEWANASFSPPCDIVLCGISMGAATVILASALDLPKNVRGIIADCPYSSASEVILRSGRKMGFPKFLIKPLASLAGVLYGGFRLRDGDVAKAAKQSKIPILLIHGEEDSLVPISMGEKIADAECVSFHRFPVAKHGMSFLVDSDRYISVWNSFLKKILTPED